MARRKRYVPNGIRDDNCQGMQPLGYDCGKSELQLYQFARRRAVEGWEYSYGHRDFVAGVAPSAEDAVLHYLVA